MTFHAPLTDHERAGRALAHPLVLLLPEPAVRTLSAIAMGDAPATTAERQFLRQVLAAIATAEIVASREASA